jgi:hypothetical protein
MMSMKQAGILSGRRRREALVAERMAKFQESPKTKIDAPATGGERLHAWFGRLFDGAWKISRRPFLVMPRVLMHDMPDDWQLRMAECLEEFAARFPECDDDFRVRCHSKTTGKWCPTPEFYLSYLKRDGLAEVAKMRAAEAGP